MSRRAGSGLLTFALVLFAADAGWSQIAVQPVTVPTVTAESEPWYLNGEPITYAGNLYYPAGAEIFFNATEMVRSGFYMGIPLYTRRTIEPYSIVFVPLAGGRMQPYARPRTGELTGTSGSLPTALPHPAATVPPSGLAAQAAGPPSQTALFAPVQLPRPAVVDDRPDPRGAGVDPRRVERGTHTRIGGRPRGTNAIFIEYNGRRWYPQGAPQPLDRATVERIGTYRGFDVWAMSADADVIYIPVTHGSTSVVAYSRMPPNDRIR